MLSDLFQTVNSVVSGGERYLSATRVGFEIEQTYRAYRNRASDLSPLEQRKLLAQTHHQGARKLTQLFHDNGAIWVKFGQFLSSRSDILPMQYVMELEKLQDDAKPVSFSSIERVLRREWGSQWRQQFQSFDEQPVAAASVAQVHRAVLATGEAVAVKVQLPHARKLFNQDSLVFRALGTVGAPLISQFDLKQVTDQIIDMTLQELDFLSEEANLRKFRALPHDSLIYVPTMYEQLSTSRVLVTEWIDGLRLTDYLNRNPQRAEGLLRQLLSCYVQQITQFGVYHADPHPGNFLVMADGRVAVLDYGAIGELTPEETQHYATLLQVLFGKLHTDQPLGQLFRKAGFVARDQAVFEEVADLVLKENLRNHEATDILGIALDRMRNLKVRIPDSFVSLARVVLTFGGLLKTYRIAVD
ncbi:MAG: AarF/UbiB family protein [Pseudomonadota bacterium]|nr:AarF/UbiB family protein [Pseudomonadota bacterium]